MRLERCALPLSVLLAACVLALDVAACLTGYFGVDIIMFIGHIVLFLFTYSVILVWHRVSQHERIIRFVSNVTGVAMETVRKWTRKSAILLVLATPSIALVQVFVFIFTF